MGTVLYELHFNWTDILELLVPLIVGLGFFFCFKWYPAQNPGIDQKGAKGYGGYVFFKWVGWIVGTLALLLFILLVISYVFDYTEKKDQLESNDVLVVEGYVEQYHAMPKEGHDTEHFEIDGVYFEYTSYEVIVGYNVPACNGGVINENGQCLKIKYVVDESGRNIILYIEDISEYKD